MSRSPFDMVVVGASSGGLQAFRELLGALPARFPVPLAVVQHRRADSGSRLAELLDAATSLEVREADDRETPAAGTVYLAPPGYHLLVEAGAFRLSVDPPESYARPSIDVLFESATEAFGRRVAGVLLTAASEDGAQGIAAIAARGGLTIVEDPETAFSPIAPRAALARARVQYVRPLGQIAPLLLDLAGSGGRSPAMPPPAAPSIFLPSRRPAGRSSTCFRSPSPRGGQAGPGSAGA